MWHRIFSISAPRSKDGNVQPPVSVEANDRERKRPRRRLRRSTCFVAMLTSCCSGAKRKKQEKLKAPSVNQPFPQWNPAQEPIMSVPAVPNASSLRAREEGAVEKCRRCQRWMKISLFPNIVCLQYHMWSLGLGLRRVSGKTCTSKICTVFSLDWCLPLRLEVFVSILTLSRSTPQRS